MRKVKPYYFEYKTFAKQRWYGKTLLDVFQSEFRDRTIAYYEVAMRKGLVMVNDALTDPGYIVKNSDVISHKIHRHEPPITAAPIKILHKTDTMLVVDKPASVPVHPSGRYRFNSLVEILRWDHGFKHISVINRLDRLTSGIVMLGVEQERAVELHTRMQAREYQKTYVCRIIGKFDESMTRCDAPLKAVEHKLGLVNVAVDGKESETTFRLLAYNEELDQSLVEAKPLTGRTHQIRVHLQALGHPIVNDHLYNNPIWSTAEPIQDNPLPYKSYSEETLRKVADELLKTTFYDEISSDQPETTMDPVEDVMSLCPECDVVREDPTEERLCIYLHAKKYSCDEFEFEADLPPWTSVFNIYKNTVTQANSTVSKAK